MTQKDPSSKTKKAPLERALGYVVKKYARRAKRVDVSPHDLRHRFGYRIAKSVPLHRTKQDLQQAVETIAWK